MLLGGAKLLKKRESELKGTVKLIFQPAEEGGAGGERMVKEGVPPSIRGPFIVVQEAGHVQSDMRTSKECVSLFTSPPCPLQCKAS